MFIIGVLNILVSFFLIFHGLGWLISLVKFRKVNVLENVDRKYACIITAYKNADISIPLIESLQNQAYENYEIYLIADQCNPLLCNQIRETYNINVIVSENPLNSKIKSIKRVYSELNSSFDAVVIFDPDNLAHPQYLLEINKYMNAGYEAVQGKRTAKNLNTTVACLDALGEFYYNVNTRLLPFKIGSSATIAGSGMAIKYSLYQDYLNLEELTESNGKIVNSEDKVLQNYIVGSNKIIAYASNAVVYDEKIETSSQMQRQRTRWINTWFRHVSESIFLFKRGTWNTLWFAFLTIYPPMFLICISTLILIFIDLLAMPSMLIVLIGSITLYISHFIYSLKLANAPLVVFKSITYIPLFICNQVISLVQMGKTKNDFLVTEHTNTIRINEILQ